MNMTSFKDISEMTTKRFSDCSLGKMAEGKAFDKPMSEYDKPLGLIDEIAKNCPIEGNGGSWDGERGNSTWYPDKNYVPAKIRGKTCSNPEGLPMGKMLDKYSIDGMSYKEGEPSFTDVSKGMVEIEPFSLERTDNFDKADMELAKQKDCAPGEVKKWRKESNYTWHECKDMKTMQKVPNEIHANFSHSGGISEAKKGVNNNE